jgi:hypothetical protein
VTHKILICLSCQGIVEPSNIRKHFVKYHPTQKTPLTLQDLINDEARHLYPDLTSSPAYPTTPVLPVYGLEDPVFNYQMCNTCKHCFASKKTFDKHTPCPRDSGWVTTAAQRFIKNTLSPWFPVQHITAPSFHQPSRWAIYQSQRSTKIPSTQHSYSDDIRVLHQFLRGERWLERVEGCKPEDLVRIASYSTQDIAYSGLHLHIRAFLSAAQLDLDEPFLRRSIGLRPAEDKEHARVKYHKDVNYATLDHYSRIIASMICFMDRIISNIDTPYTFPIPADITDACRDLISSLPSVPSNIEDLFNEDELDGDEVVESSASSEEEDACSPRIHARSAVTSTITPIQSKITALLYLLFTHLPSTQFRGQFFTPIYHFLVLSAIRKNGEWASANIITHTIAAILFTGRLTFAWKTSQLVRELGIDSTR